MNKTATQIMLEENEPLPYTTLEQLQAQEAEHQKVVDRVVTQMRLRYGTDGPTEQEKFFLELSGTVLARVRKAYHFHQKIKFDRMLAMQESELC